MNKQMMYLNDDSIVECILPTELADGLFRDDWSALHPINDYDYINVIKRFIEECIRDGYELIDMYDDDSYCEYHDLTSEGISPQNCSSFIFQSNNG